MGLEVRPTSDSKWNIIVHLNVFPLRVTSKGNKRWRDRGTRWELARLLTVAESESPPSCLIAPCYACISHTPQFDSFLPTEIFDHTTRFLVGERKAFKQFRLIQKSWIPPVENATSPLSVSYRPASRQGRSKLRPCITFPTLNDSSWTPFGIPDSPIGGSSQLLPLNTRSAIPDFSPHPFSPLLEHLK